jgi:hypothetical protein
MRKSHVDQRSRRYAARQYVAETHDHKPDAKRRLAVRPLKKPPSKEKVPAEAGPK